MTKYEQLLAEYDCELNIEERTMLCEGLYCDGNVWINSKNNTARKASILAEEIGHYKTSSGDILDLSQTGNAKQENRARKWAVNKLLPLQDIQKAIKRGYTEVWDIADFLGVDEEFLLYSLRHYRLLDDK